MALDRVLKWDSCNNVRDLGGLNAANGCRTRWGAVVRGDHPSKLTANGWSALYAHGIRTIVSLRTHGFDEQDHPIVVPPHSDIQVVSAEIEDVTNEEFVEKWASSDLWSTPLYYSDALNLWAHRHAAALKAIAQAKPGGVLFHCIRGHDRTGILALLLLALVGVSPEDILADYELSIDPERDRLLAEQNTTTRETILATLASINVEEYLLAGGLSQTELGTIRTHMLE
ncbi:MAG TPA: tyrosine-protein phosphatase [Anaerolineales bacterium]